MIEIDIEKKFPQIELRVKLDVENGSFVAVSGNSGSGKTTLLRILSGLEEARGVIRVDEDTWLDNKTYKAPQLREIGFVFQDYALFPNMTVEENLLYVKKDKSLAKELLEIVELSEFKDRYPQNLSGGQKQRVALARAMMSRPKILILDEPLSALDSSMRKKLQDEILILHKKFNTTSFLVSHDVSEIYRMCDRVVVLDSGKIIKDGTPKEVLLKTSGSQKFSFEGELLEVVKADVIYVAIIAIARQIVEIVISKDEAEKLQVGQKVRVGTKAFAPEIFV